jgi:hypothetical protein
MSGCTTLTTAESASVATAAVVGSGAEPPVCRVWHDIFVSALDSVQARRAAKGNNAARQAYGCRSGDAQ